MTVARIALSGITKRYPGVIANQDVSLEVKPGEIHAVLGENGAGKSTLMKIIYGAVQPDAGELHWNGRRVVIDDPRAARALGVAMVFQHFSLFESLTVAENVGLGQDRGRTRASVVDELRRLSHDYALDVDPDRPVHALSVGERQRVEILRALLGSPQLLILDEPTSVLPPQAVGSLFALLRQLASGGCSILYISHKLDEIRTLCESCTVLRGGRVTGRVRPSEETNASLAQLMIGAEPPTIGRSERTPGAPVLEVKDLDLPKRDRFDVALRSLSFQVCAGEIVGIAGVSGNGQAQLVAALSGEDARGAAGSLALFGRERLHASTQQRRREGLRCVPEERLGRGAVPGMSLAHNTLLTRTHTLGPLGWLQLGAAGALARRLIEQFRVEATGPAARAASLSGGNLQKFIVGRELDAAPGLLIVSQPTWGLDVGAAAAIRAELLRLRDAGSGVLVVSEDLDELFEISDRLYVIARGQLSPSVPIRSANTAQIGAYMSGLWPGHLEAHA